MNQTHVVAHGSVAQQASTLENNVTGANKTSFPSVSPNADAFQKTSFFEWAVQCKCSVYDKSYAHRYVEQLKYMLLKFESVLSRVQTTEHVEQEWIDWAKMGSAVTNVVVASNIITEDTIDDFWLVLECVKETTKPALLGEKRFIGAGPRFVRGFEKGTKKYWEIRSKDTERLKEELSKKKEAYNKLLNSSEKTSGWGDRSSVMQMIATCVGILALTLLYANTANSVISALLPAFLQEAAVPVVQTASAAAPVVQTASAAAPVVQTASAAAPVVQTASAAAAAATLVTTDQLHVKPPLYDPPPPPPGTTRPSFSPSPAAPTPPPPPRPSPPKAEKEEPKNSNSPLQPSSPNQEKKQEPESSRRSRINSLLDQLSRTLEIAKTQLEENGKKAAAAAFVYFNSSEILVLLNLCYHIWQSQGLFMLSIASGANLIYSAYVGGFNGLISLADISWLFKIIKNKDLVKGSFLLALAPSTFTGLASLFNSALTDAKNRVHAKKLEAAIYIVEEAELFLHISEISSTFSERQRDAEIEKLLNNFGTKHKLETNDETKANYATVCFNIKRFLEKKTPVKAAVEAAERRQAAANDVGREVLPSHAEVEKSFFDRRVNRSLWIEHTCDEQDTLQKQPCKSFYQQEMQVCLNLSDPERKKCFDSLVTQAAEADLKHKYFKWADARLQGMTKKISTDGKKISSENMEKLQEAKTRAKQAKAEYDEARKKQFAKLTVKKTTQPQDSTAVAKMVLELKYALQKLLGITDSASFTGRIIPTGEPDKVIVQEILSKLHKLVAGQEL